VSVGGAGHERRELDDRGVGNALSSETLFLRGGSIVPWGAYGGRWTDETQGEGERGRGTGSSRSMGEKRLGGTKCGSPLLDSEKGRGGRNPDKRARMVEKSKARNAKRKSSSKEE